MIRTISVIATAVSPFLFAGFAYGQDIDVFPIPGTASDVTITGDGVTIRNVRLTNRRRGTTGTLYIGIRATTESESTSLGYHLLGVNDHPNRRGLARLGNISGLRSVLGPGERADIYRAEYSLSGTPPAGTYYIHIVVYEWNTSLEDNGARTQIGSNTLTSRVTFGGGGGGGDDHGDSRSSATRVSVPSTTAGRIETGSDEDYFRFEVSSRGTVQLETTGGTDTTGTLYDSAGTRLAYNDDSGTGNNFRISRTLSAGTYYVAVGSYRTRTGAYTLSITGGGGGGGGGGDDHGDSRSSATRVSVPSTTAGRIETGSDEDYFRFEVSSRGTVQLETTGGTDTTGTLYDSAGTRLAYNDNSGTGSNFRISTNLSAGTYYVAVGSYRTRTGAYTLSITGDGGDGGDGGGGGGGGDDHGDSRSSATRVSVPSTTAGRIETGSDEDYFRFEVSSRGTVQLETTGGTDTTGTLYDSAGTRLAYNDDSGTGSNFRISTNLSAGTYYVAVGSYRTRTGAYTLSITGDGGGGGGGGGGGDDHGDSRSSATRVSVPSTTAGRIETGSDEDYFRFEVSSRGTVQLETTGGTDTTGTLYDSAGTRLAYNDDSGTGSNFRISTNLSAGTYYVAVGSYRTRTGAYTLSITGGGDDGGICAAPQGWAPIQQEPAPTPSA